MVIRNVVFISLSLEQKKMKSKVIVNRPGPGPGQEGHLPRAPRAGGPITHNANDI